MAEERVGKAIREEGYRAKAEEDAAWTAALQAVTGAPPDGSG